jgi:hypothetical protein
MYQLKPLQDTKLSEIAPRIWYYCAAPLWISLVIALASLLNARWNDILVAAVTGQMALTLIKLFLYTACLMLSLATALEGVWGLPKALMWSGERLAGVAFDGSSVAIGVVVGILPVAMIQNGCKALFATIIVMVIMLAIQCILWVCCYMAFGKLKPHVKEAPWLPRAMGVAFTALFVWAFHHERWLEVAKQNCPPEAKSTVVGPARLGT